MPEPSDSPLPAVLRRRLSTTEQNVLTLSKRPDPVYAVRNVLGLASDEQARELIERTKAKAAQILDGELSSNGGLKMVRCACGTEFVPRAGDGGKCSACRQGGAIRAPRPKPGGRPKITLPPLQPPQHPRGNSRRARKAEQREQSERARERMPMPSARDLEPEREEQAVQPMPTRPPAARIPPADAERKDRALALLREEGPMRQADLTRRLRISSPAMSILKRYLRAEVEEVDRVDQSPVLRLRGDEREFSQRNGEIGGEEPEESPEISAEESDHESAHMDASVDTSADTSDDEEPPARVEGERVDDGKLREPTPDEEAQSAAALLIRRLHEVERLVEDIDGAVPPVLLKARYLAALLAKIEGGDTSPELLDRFERLSGITDVGQD